MHASAQCRCSYGGRDKKLRLGYQAMRLEEFERTRSIVDDMNPPARYPMRGIKEDGEYRYGALTWDEIHSLDTAFLRYSIDLYSNFRLLGGLPHGGGWMDERRSITDILRILKSEENAFDAWEREKSMNSIRKK